jgi:hypothetical protein
MKPEEVPRKNSMIISDSKNESISNENYNKIAIIGDADTEADTRDIIKKSEYKSCAKVLRESINMPFISGIVAIALASLPFVGAYLAHPNSIMNNLIISKIILLRT